MNTARWSATRYTKNFRNRPTFMLPTSFHTLSKSTRMKDLMDASKSRSRITKQIQEINPVSKGVSNLVSERAPSAGLVVDDPIKKSKPQSCRVTIQRIVAVKPVLKTDDKLSNQDSRLSESKSDIGTSTSAVTSSKKRVYPFEILFAMGKELSKKQRLSNGLEMQEKKQHDTKAEVTPINVASNKTGQEDSKECDQEENLKMRREKERTAARIALEKMEKTAMISDNQKGFEELELLVRGCPSDIFQTLGLVLKHEYNSEVEEEEEEEEEIVDVRNQATTTSSSPALRAELMRKRFAATILKATQKMEEIQHDKVTSAVAVVESKKSEAANLKKIEEAKRFKVKQEKELERARIALQRLYEGRRTRYTCPGKEEVEEGEIVC